MVVSGPAVSPNNQHPEVIILFWLVLAHELAHARHNQLGTKARKGPMTNALTENQMVRFKTLRLIINTSMVYVKFTPGYTLKSATQRLYSKLKYQGALLPFGNGR